MMHGFFYELTIACLVMYQINRSILLDDSNSFIVKNLLSLYLQLHFFGLISWLPWRVSKIRDNKSVETKRKVVFYRELGYI